MATPEKVTSMPRCPTIMSDTTCKRYWDTVTTTIGAAMDPTLLSSGQNAPSKFNGANPSSLSPLFVSSGTTTDFSFLPISL